jgi:hypothetical protein
LSFPGHEFFELHFDIDEHYVSKKFQGQNVLKFIEIPSTWDLPAVDHKFCAVQMLVCESMNLHPTCDQQNLLRCCKYTGKQGNEQYQGLPDEWTPAKLDNPQSPRKSC